MPRKSRSMKGRPPAIEDQRVVQDITSCITVLGMSLERAAEASGVSHGLPAKWRGRGLKAQRRWHLLTESERILEKPYIDFVEALRSGDAMFERFHLANIANASKTAWMASVRLLAYRFPAKYGFRQVVQQAEDAPPIRHEVTVREMSEEEKLAAEKKAMAVIAARQGASLIPDEDDGDDGSPGE